MPAQVFYDKDADLAVLVGHAHGEPGVLARGDQADSLMIAAWPTGLAGYRDEDAENSMRSEAKLQNAGVNKRDLAGVGYRQGCYPADVPIATILREESVGG